MNSLVATLVGSVVAVMGIARAQMPEAPDAAITPGALNPAVMQATIHQTICVPGWSGSVRPSYATMHSIKVEMMADLRAVYGPDLRMQDFELDHRVPIGLGGDPGSRLSRANLWLQIWYPSDGWGAARKDILEVHLHDLVCADRMPLAEAQSVFMPPQDWRAEYSLLLDGITEGPGQEAGR